jgi:hypothetical protein
MLWWGPVWWELCLFVKVLWEQQQCVFCWDYG